MRNNYILKAADKLIVLIIQIGRSPTHSAPMLLQEKIIKQLNAFQENLMDICHENLLIKLRYCLCAAIDEAVLSREWGRDSQWSQQSLLSLFHQETWGGEKFYEISERFLKAPAQHKDALEFVYLLLRLGFEGKFYGASKREGENWQERILDVIGPYQRKALIGSTFNVDDAIAKKIRKKKHIKVVGLCGFFLCVLLFFIFNTLFYQKTEPLLDNLSRLYTVSPVTVFVSFSHGYNKGGVF